METAISHNQQTPKLELVDFLLSTPEFNMLTYDELDMLDKIMLVSNYSHGHKFKSVDNVYLIIEGEVAVSDKERHDTPQFTRMQPGELFGLFSLIDHNKRATTCTAVGTVRAASIPRSAFELLFRSNLPLAEHFQRITADRVVHDMHVLKCTTHEGASYL